MMLGDEILAVNGAAVTTFRPFDDPQNRPVIGGVTSYRIRKTSGTEIDVEVHWEALTFARKFRISANAVFSLSILTIASLLSLRKSLRINALLFYSLSCAYIFFKMDHPAWEIALLARLYQAIYLFAFFLIPALFLHFCSRFPKLNSLIYSKHNRVRWIYIPPVVLSVPAALSNWVHYSNTEAQSFITQLILFQGFVIWTAYLVTGSLMMVHSFFRIRSRALSRRCVMVFYSLIIAVSPYLLAGLLDVVFRRSVSAEISGMLLFLPFPLTLAWAVDYGDDREDGIPVLFDQFLKPRS